MRGERWGRVREEVERSKRGVQELRVVVDYDDKEDKRFGG